MNNSWISFGQGDLKKELEYRFINVMYIPNIKKLYKTEKNVLVEITWKLTSAVIGKRQYWIRRSSFVKGESVLFMESDWL